MEQDFTKKQDKIYRALKGLSSCGSHFVTAFDFNTTKFRNLFRMDNLQEEQTTLHQFDRIGL